MILADTSAWIEYDRATGSPVDRRLSELVKAAGRVAVPDPMEEAAGALGQRAASTRSRLRWATTACSSSQSMSLKLCIGQNFGPHIEQNSAVLK